MILMKRFGHCEEQHKKDYKLKKTVEREFTLNRNHKGTGNKI